jgi:anti-sigma factor RsiW
VTLFGRANQLLARACPEPPQLAAFVDDQLPLQERTAVIVHLVDCGVCRALVIQTVRHCLQWSNVPR